MIRTIIQISLMRLWHNKAELVLTFVVPILFFSIFACIFGSRGSHATPQLKIVICDEVDSTASRSTIELLEQTQSLQFHPDSDTSRTNHRKDSIDRAKAAMLVRRGQVSAAIILSARPDASLLTTRSSMSSSDFNLIRPLGDIDILTDSFDQVAGQVILALVQKSMMSSQIFLASAPSVNPTRSINNYPVPAVAIEQCPTPMNQEMGRVESHSIAPSIEMIDVMGAKKTNPIIAMYAAGIAVMFLLFSATTASGSLLEECENSTLERLLCSRMTMDHLLMGKWCYLVLIGILQTTLMFLVGALFFGLELVEHLDGFAAMTIVTTSAAASFALMLATLCRTRTQLGWVSTITILSMSALGGSMVPRYLMSESIQRIGQCTFNAWALDGYNKVFWRELPLVELQLELAVLAASGLVFIIIARGLAMKWDKA